MNGVECVVFFFKQKTAYEMRISDWSSDVCSSDLRDHAPTAVSAAVRPAAERLADELGQRLPDRLFRGIAHSRCAIQECRARCRADVGAWGTALAAAWIGQRACAGCAQTPAGRSLYRPVAAALAALAPTKEPGIM